MSCREPGCMAPPTVHMTEVENGTKHQRSWCRDHALTREGLISDVDEGRKGGHFTTRSGIRFYPLDPRPEDVSIKDVAHALALKVRWAGHCSEMWTVGQHSLGVGTAAAALVAPRGPRVVALARLYGLLHDAHEAYLADLPKPLKPWIEGWTDHERRVDAAVFASLGFPDPSGEPPDDDHRLAWSAVKIVDRLALSLEREELFSGVDRTSIPRPCITDMTPDVVEAYQRALSSRTGSAGEWRSVRWCLEEAITQAISQLLTLGFNRRW